MENLDNICTYGVCRCCLSTGLHRHIMKEYISEGVREFYIEMFMECLNLFLRIDSRLTMLICSDCVKRLRDAYCFRRKVMAVEQQLFDSIDKNVFVNVPVEATQCMIIKSEGKEVVKKEDSENQTRTEDVQVLICPYDSIGSQSPKAVKTEFSEQTCHTQNLVLITERHCSDSDATCDDKPEVKCENDEDKTAANVDATIQTIKPNASRNSHNSGTIKKRKISDDSCDAPIAHRSKLNCRKRADKVKLVSKNARKDVKQYSETYLSKQKVLEDNNKIRANIILILKCSTVLPFRKKKVQYDCFYCKESCILFSELKKHIDSNHSDISELTIDKLIKSYQELLVNADISSMKCRLCNEDFKVIDNLTEHLTKVHGKIFHDTARKPYHGILGFDLSSDDHLTCHICNKAFPHFRSLSAHMNEHLGRFVCNVCGKKLLSYNRLSKHIFASHKMKNKDNSNKCKQCAVVFETGSLLADHIKTEHNILKCPKCPQTFPCSQYVGRMVHMAKEHNIKRPVYKCNACGKEYATVSALGAHRRHTHKRHQEFCCDICGFTTVYGRYFKVHMEMHEGIKAFQCELCKKAFRTGNNLKLHMRGHLNDKRFVCSLCGAGFIQKISLKNHLKSRHPNSGS